MAADSASPISCASPSMSASKSVLPTTASVYAAISRGISRTSPSCQWSARRSADVAVCGGACAMKRRLCKAALAKMEFVLTREEAFAEQDLRALEAASLVKMTRVRDEHVANVIGMADQHDRLAADVNHGDVAVGLFQRRKIRKGP